jgi:hypothetical protein
MQNVGLVHEISVSAFLRWPFRFGLGMIDQRPPRQRATSVLVGRELPFGKSLSVPTTKQSAGPIHDTLAKSNVRGGPAAPASGGAMNVDTATNVAAAPVVTIRRRALSVVRTNPPVRHSRPGDRGCHRFRLYRTYRKARRLARAQCRYLRTRSALPGKSDDMTFEIGDQRERRTRDAHRFLHDRSAEPVSTNV